MKIKLVTDYLDYYDHSFYPDGDVIYTRNQHSSMLRRDAFKFLDHTGFQTVDHGVVKDFVPVHLESLKQNGIYEEPEIELATTLSLANIDKKQELMEAQIRQTRNELFKDQAQVVVYTDETAHRGEGKVVMSYWDALEQYPNVYCSQFYQTTMGKGSLSERLLFVGNVGFRVQYASDDWRSNYGNVQIAVTQRFVYPIEKAIVPYPIFAVDFITENNLAIDFNTAPGLDCIKKFMTPTEIYEAVEDWFGVNNEVLVN